jgi:hypothetical protein
MLTLFILQPRSFLCLSIVTNLECLVLAF